LSTVVLALLLLAVGATQAEARTPLVGIADQKTSMFTDPLFVDLGVGHARIVVPWDAMDGGFPRDEFVAWMRAARAAGVRPLLTFGPSRRPARLRVSPSPAEFQRQFKRIRASFPWAREFSTWNEPNHCGLAVCKRPDLPARYFDALVRACRTCTILGADMLDTPNMTSWVRRFRPAAVNEPKAWALHNYVDTNRFRTKGTKTLLRITRGELWLTETGGIVKRRTRGKIPLTEGVGHAADATRWLFDRLVPLSSRIRRVYLYHWDFGATPNGWDSALLARDGTPREALRVVRARLDRGDVAVSRSAPTMP
jgi:hypothetical protein